jgi:hypothetical protein
MSYNAKAIVCHDTLANGGWKMEDVSVRKPGEGELLVEMVASVSPRRRRISNSQQPENQPY